MVVFGQSNTIKSCRGRRWAGIRGRIKKNVGSIKKTIRGRAARQVIHKRTKQDKRAERKCNKTVTKNILQSYFIAL